MMDLRKYMREVWEICDRDKNPDCSDMHIAQAMFECNLREGKEMYKGTGTLDYAALSKEWNGLPAGERQKSSNAFSNALHFWYFELAELWKNKEYDVFDKLAFAPFLGQKVGDDGLPGVWSKKEQNHYKHEMVKKIRAELHPTDDPTGSPA